MDFPPGCNIAMAVFMELVDSTQMSLDLSELHPLAKNLDLEILATNEVSLAVIPVTNEVAGLVKLLRDTVAGTPARILGVHGISSFLVSQVSSSQGRTLDDKLTNGPNWNRSIVIVWIRKL